MSVIGIDFGGTNIKVATLKGVEIIVNNEVPTPKEKSEKEVMDALIHGIEISLREDTTGIGIGVPSVVDRKKGIVYDVSNIPSWKEVHLKKELEKKFKIPVYLDNDANCFAIGEKIYGKGKDFDNFVGITLGTGTGAGIINNGKILDDANCGSGEFGMVHYLDGIYEHYCSSQFFTAKGTTGFAVYQSVLKGDEKAIAIMNEFGKHIGCLVKLVVLSVDPSMIIFGGSIAQSFNLFKDEMNKELLNNFAYPKSIQNLKIMSSELKNMGILGAAALCEMNKKD